MAADDIAAHAIGFLSRKTKKKNRRFSFRNDIEESERFFFFFLSIQ